MSQPEKPLASIPLKPCGMRSGSLDILDATNVSTHSNKSKHSMKKILFVIAMALTVTSLAGADSTPKDDVINSVKKLGEQPNYAWRTTIVVPEDAPFKPGPTDGKTEKNGFTWISASMFDNTLEALVKGDKGAVKQEGSWKSLDDIDKEEGFARMPAWIARNTKAPTKEAAELAAAAKELKKEGEIISSDLTTEGAKTLLTFRGLDGEIPSITEAMGSVKFWIKDGILSKYEFKLKGKITINGNEWPNDRTTTVEIKEAGKTKLEIPEDARKKISG